MLVYVLNRLVQAIPVIIGVTLVVFLLVQIPSLITGTDPIELMVPVEADRGVVAEMRRYYGLDKPWFFNFRGSSVIVQVPKLELHKTRSLDSDVTGRVQQGEELRVTDRRGDWIKLVTAEGNEGWCPVELVQVCVNLLDGQYFNFLWHLMHGEVGKSWKHSVEAFDLIVERVPATAELALVAMAIALVVGIPVGTFSATRQYSIWDNIATTFAIVGRAMPIFWLGLLLILLFAVKLGWLPATGRGSWKHLILPAIALSGNTMATMMRLTRSCVLDELGRDYVRTARGKGLSERAVIYRHVLRNSLIPLVTVAGLQFAALLGGAVVTESIFAWPGIGRLTWQAIYNRDLPLIQGCALFVGFVYIGVNLLVDVLYALLDPRIRYQ
jgi:peptide/nickel transport system permease protein